MKGSLHRIKLVAKREFLATVISKGFLFGVLVMPVLITLILIVLPKMMANRGAQVQVEVAVIDHSQSAFTASLRAELSAEAIAGRQQANLRDTVEQIGAPNATPAALLMAVPAFTLKELPADTTMTDEEQWLTATDLGKHARRALVVIPREAVHSGAQSGYSSYQLYIPRNLPQDAERILHAAVRPAVIGERLRSSGFDPQIVRAATDIPRTGATLVPVNGPQQGAQILNRLMPFIMGILLFMGIMVGGQGLMTSTVEEKSSRVVEVLLAAASSLELMWGKLLGQLGVGLVMMAMYVGLGVLALLQFALFGLVDPMLILWLFLFFLTAYLVFGALMMAIGAAVNQIADAQSLMGPIMILMIVPYIATPMVGNAPDSAFALTSSFIPPINGFIMMARLASTSPPPMWQVMLSLAVSLVAACIAVWFAAKVFRVGLLMHGKPPSFATLIKWARMS
ncbi:MAG TPA: ABC transporter permease [Steroidobacteraceae bacterium]|nr:ABC transporter permease [Steroidobacteraceae bacterium]